MKAKLFVPLLTGLVPLLCFLVACTGKGKETETGKEFESDSWGIHVRCGAPDIVIFKNDPQLNDAPVTVVVTALDKCEGDNSEVILNNPGKQPVTVTLQDFKPDTRAYKVDLNGLISIKCKGQGNEDNYCVYDID